MKNHPAFQHTDHRPWPLPETNWRWQQQWNDLVFVHWEVDPNWLRSRIPEGLEIDLHDGKAWLGIVPFSMKGVTLRKLPAPGFLCDFPEINLRTYVKRDGKQGVWFFSLDITQWTAVWIARTFFHLPYYKAQIATQNQGNQIEYHFRRNPLEFHASYTPETRVQPEKDSFENWATERYCLYSDNKKGDLFRAEIHHRQWPLQAASIEVHTNTMLNHWPVGCMHPSVLYSKTIDVVVYPLEKI